jgi:hypothetical protein
MRGANSVPKDSPLGCILKYWECFDPANLKKEHFTYYCNEVWPQYQLETKKWCENGSLDYDTILQLDQFCKKQDMARDTIHESRYGLISKSNPL